MGACGVIIILPLIVVIITITWIFSNIFGDITSSGASKVQSKDKQAMIKFILQEKAKGSNDARIICRLKYSGWANDEINEAFYLINSNH